MQKYIIRENNDSTYHFGPFDSIKEAADWAEVYCISIATGAPTRFHIEKEITK